MISVISIKNFKCFRKLEVKPRLITVFIGPNGSGKSSVLQALAILKQSDSARLKLDGPLVSAPNFEKLRPNFGQRTAAMSMAFSGTHQGEPIEFEIESTSGNLDVKKECAERNPGSIVGNHGIGAGDEGSRPPPL